MIQVRFLKQWRSYFSGDVAVFAEAIAEALANQGIATYTNAAEASRKPNREAINVVLQPPKEAPKVEQDLSWPELMTRAKAIAEAKEMKLPQVRSVESIKQFIEENS